MSIEVRPLGVSCNIRCHYCYQNPQRDARNVGHRFDVDRMKAEIEKAAGETGDRSFTVFGGEPLLVPIEVLEDLWTWGHEKYGSTSIQTNGTLISDRHLELFERCNVRVGISVDGPDELNDTRWSHDLKKTREMTERTHGAIRKLCEMGRPPSLILTLSKANASAELLPRMSEWLKELDGMGIRNVRLHILETENAEIHERWALSDEENIAAFLHFLDLESDLGTIRFDLFADMRNLLLGRDRRATCVWKACDPLTTRAVRGIEGNGQSSNCGRTNKEGIDFVKASREGFERYLALHRTSREAGGCRDCRFFLMCKGQCPGTAIDSDWRNRSVYCGVWMALFERLESDLMEAGEMPLSVAPFRKAIEAEMVEAWAGGRNPSIERLAERRFQNGGAGISNRSEKGAGASGSPLPEFVRLSWVSDGAREKWKERFEKASRAWYAIERRAVAAGLRRCALASVSPEEFPDYALDCAMEGLSVLPVGRSGPLEGGFSNRAVPVRSGGRYSFRVVVGTIADVREFADAWKNRDDLAIGALLGYPECCNRFFRRQWHDRGRFDTTWPMVGGDDNGTTEIAMEGVPETNIHCRWFGVRAVPHLPCGVRCEASIDLGRRLRRFGEELGLCEEMETIREALSWPLEWSSLNGVAIVKTPVLKVVCSTDFSPVRRRLRLEGSEYPDEGARGIVFPYRLDGSKRRGDPAARTTA